MTTPQLIDDLKRDENYAKALPNGDCQAYPDPVSNGAPWTIGYGHTGIEVYPGVVITRAQAEAYLGADIARAVSLCDRYMPWWRKLDDVRQDVLANMMFNMGWGDGTAGLSSFKNTLAAIQRGDYAAAADGMTKSKWASQVGDRAGRLIHMMLFGVRGDAPIVVAPEPDVPPPPPTFPAPQPSWFASIFARLTRRG